MGEIPFFTKAGRLTRYALACGYIERAEVNNVSVTLWAEGGPCIHVRQHDHNSGQRIFWDSFENISEARERFDKARRTL